METAVQVAIIVASGAIILVATMLAVALYFVISILYAFRASLRDIKKVARSVGREVHGVLQGIAEGA